MKGLMRVIWVEDQGRDGKGEETLCRALGVGRDDKGNGSGGRDGKEDSALDTASS